MCAQARHRVILPSEIVLRNGIRTHVDSKEKIPTTGGSEEGRTRDAASRGTASPTHNRLSYSGPALLREHQTYVQGILCLENLLNSLLVDAVVVSLFCQETTICEEPRLNMLPSKNDEHDPVHRSKPYSCGSK